MILALTYLGLALPLIARRDSLFKHSPLGDVTRKDLNDCLTCLETTIAESPSDRGGKPTLPWC